MAHFKKKIQCSLIPVNFMLGFKFYVVTVRVNFNSGLFIGPKATLLLHCWKAVLLRQWRPTVDNSVITVSECHLSGRDLSIYHNTFK